MAIDEKKLKEDVKKYFAKLKAHNVHELVELFFEDIIGIIDEQPKLSLENKTSDKWIPCSERLPIHEGEYLVTCKGKYRHFTEVLYFQHGRFLSCLCEVVAWFDAPLPEPYKGEE